MAEVGRLFDFSTTACVRLLLNHSHQSTQALSQHLVSQLTSRQFTLVTDHLLQIIVDHHPKQLTNQLLTALLPQDLSCLILKGCLQISVTGILDALTSLKSLRVLDLRECVHLMQPAFFRCCAQSAPQINVLNLESCFTLSDESIQCIFERMVHLEHLNISQCNNITENAFLLGANVEEFDGRAPKSWKSPLAKLKSLNISGCHSLSDMTMCHLSVLCGPSLMDFNASFTLVSTSSLLYLAGFSLSTVASVQRHCDALTNKQMEMLFLKKKELSFSQRILNKEKPCCVFTEDFVPFMNPLPTNHHEDTVKVSHKPSPKWSLSDRWLQSYIPVLRILNVSHLKRYCTEANVHLKMLLLAHPQLEKLEVAWPRVDDEVLAFMANCLPHLSHLSLENCQQITNEGMRNLCTECPRLRNLNLQGACFITTEAIAPLLKQGQVQTLNLAETQITDSASRLLSAHCSHEIRSLDVSWCEEMGGLEEVAKSCVNLQNFKLRMCNTSETFLKNLVHNCQSLQHLDLARTTILNDRHLVSIALRLQCLESLDVSWNIDVTDVGVRGILCYCTKLKSLNLAGDKRLTSEPFLPIVTDWKAFFRSQAALVVRYSERQSHDSGEDSTDEEMDDVVVINRSTVYAPKLRFLDLEYVDCVQDSHLSHIVAVCRGTLAIKDYYSYNVEPKIFSKGIGRPVLSEHL